MRDSPIEELAPAQPLSAAGPELHASRRRLLGTILLAGLLPALASLATHFAGRGSRWPHGETHTVLELLGGFTAAVVTGLMLMRRRPRPSHVALCCGCGLLMMGTFDVVHALVAPGAGFVWLRTLGNLVGGVMFALVWWPAERVPPRIAPLAPALAMILSAAACDAVVIWRFWFPPSVDNGFTGPIVLLNLLAGTLFLIAGAGLSGRVAAAEGSHASTLLGCALLFGVAALSFAESRLWDPQWWTLHLFRLVAYLVLARHFLHEYQRTTDQLGASVALLEAERRRFRDVLDVLPAYVLLLTPDYRVAFSNRIFRERFGESHDRCCYRFLFQRDTPCDICETYTVLKTGRPLTWSWLGPDGRDYDVFDFPFTDADGSPLILEMGLDISERKKAEEQARTASRYARNLIETSLDPLVTISQAGKIMDVNHATEQVTGVSREELIGSDFSDYFTDPGEARRGYEQVFDRGFVRDYPLAIRHEDGRVTDVLYNATVFRNHAGEVEGVFAAARDITERKRGEVELQRLNRALRTLSRCTNAVARESDEPALLRSVCEIVVQDDGYPLAWVGYAENDEQRTVRPAAVAGAGADYVRNARITWADTERGCGPTGTAIRTGAPCYIPEITLDPRFSPWQQAALHHGYASVIAIPLMEAGRSFGALNIYAPEANAFEGEEYILMLELAATLEHGILALRAHRERDRAAAELRELNETLERRVAQRTAELAASIDEMESFTYSVSHDLRAPLRHIDGFSKVLLEQCGGQVDDLSRHYLERVRHGTQQMGQLVDDLLNLSRLGRLALQVRPTALGPMVETLVDELQSEAAGRPVEWHIGTLPRADCDPGLMRQVLFNLLSNALKFTRGRDPAIIEVGVRGSELFVRDNGVGFDPQYAGKLFGVFQRLHRCEEFPGTGVGLATVRRILRKHGGDIRVEAALDAGATFYFTLGQPEIASGSPATEESHAA